MKILIIRFSSIGDIVLTTPVLRLLKKNKNNTLHYLTKEAFAPLLQDNPHLEKIFLYKSGDREIISHLRAENYDLIIDLHHTLRSFYVRMMLRKPTISTHKGNIRKLITIYTGLQVLNTTHQVEKHIAALNSLHISDDGQGLEIFINTSNIINPASLGINGPYLAFSLGATHATKKLPPDTVKAIIEQLKMPVLLLGGGEDRRWAEEIIATFPYRAIYSACGLYNLQQSASAIAQAAGVFAFDTGMMHIAAALDKPLVTVWGATVPALGFYPLYKKNAQNRAIYFEVKDLTCRPCSRAGTGTCPKGHFRCMREQDSHRIAMALQSLF